MVYRLIDEERQRRPVCQLCRALGVARSGFYQWQHSRVSDRQIADWMLTEQIREVCRRSDETYGSPRVHAELRLEHGIRVSNKRVARLVHAWPGSAWSRLEPGTSRQYPGRMAAGPSPQPDRPDVFISYSRRELEFVRSLEDALAARRKEVWVDLEDIPKTADWRATIERGVESAKAVVAVLSPSFAASQVCGEEIRIAIRHNKRLIPVLREDVSPEQLVPELNAPNWILARAGDDAQQAVEQLVEALETDLAWLDQHARLLVRAGEWQRHDRDRSFLLRGSDLRAAEQWLGEQRGHREQATELQSLYIKASKKAARRRRRVGVVAAAIAVAAPILGALALFQRGEATERASESRSRRLAAAAIDDLAADPTNALRLALNAADASRTPEAIAAIRRALVNPRPHALLRVPGNALRSAAFVDARHVVGTSYDGVVRRWPVDGGDAVVVRRGGSNSWGPPTSRAAGLIAKASRGRVTVTDSITGATVLTLSRLGRGLEGSGPQASLSRDGRWLVTAGYEDDATVWAIPARVIPVPRGGDTCAVPVGRFVATCDFGRSRIAVWQPGARQPLRVLDGYVDVAASNDRRFAFVTSERSRKTMLIEPSTGRVIRGFPAGSALASALSSDGRLAFIPGENGLGARVADAATGATRFELPLGAFGFATVAFDADGDRLVTSHRQEDVVRVWDAAAGGKRLAQLGQFAAPVEAVAISPSGTSVATASGEVAQLWRVPGGNTNLRLEGHRQFVLDVAFSGDGAFVVTGGGDAKARVWTSDDGSLVATFGGHHDAIVGAAFGPDADSVITLGLDGAVIVHECAACAPADVVVRRAREALMRGASAPAAPPRR